MNGYDTPTIQTPTTVRRRFRQIARLCVAALAFTVVCAIPLATNANASVVVPGGYVSASMGCGTNGFLSHDLEVDVSSPGPIWVGFQLYDYSARSFAVSWTGWLHDDGTEAFIRPFAFNPEHNGWFAVKIWYAYQDASGQWQMTSEWIKDATSYFGSWTDTSSKAYWCLVS